MVLRRGQGERYARQTETMLPEKCVKRRRRLWDGMRVIVGCFARTPQRRATHTNMRCLPIFQ
jgi:hypothetical protein